MGRHAGQFPRQIKALPLACGRIIPPLRPPVVKLVLGSRPIPVFRASHICSPDLGPPVPV